MAIMSIANLTLPPITVEVDGQFLSQAALALLGEARIQQRLSLPSQCELVFLGQGDQLVELSQARPGTPLRVSIEDGTEPLFDGKITALEYSHEPAGGMELRLRGYDVLQQLRRRGSARALTQTSLGELARELVGDLGLTITGLNSDHAWLRVIQQGQNDFELLAQRASDCGQFFTLRGNVLHFLTLAGLDPPLSLRLGETLLQASIEWNSDSACDAISIFGWNNRRAQVHTGRADQPRSGRSHHLPANSQGNGSNQDRIVVNAAIENDAQAEVLAQAELDTRNAAEMVLRGVAEGNPLLRPGARVELEQTAQDGCFVLTTVIHRFGAGQGYVSEISSVPTPSPPRPRGCIATLGRITRVNDPEALGRVQAALPAYQEAETDWMPVLAPGAGTQKGLLLLPDVGDHVLVLCAQEDLSQGMVLGGLYAEKPPDSGVAGDKVKRHTWSTPGGQQLQFNDDSGTVKLKNGKGSHLTLSSGKVVLHSATDLEIAAPGRSILIRAQQINFEQAP
jgi:phage baseplate assembly protein gpV/phage protein D